MKSQTLKRRLAILLIGAMLLTMIACVPQNADNQGGTPQKVVLVTTERGLGDGAINDMAYEGLLSAKKDFGIEDAVVEPKTGEDYRKAIGNAATEGADLVIGLKPLSSSAMKKIAKEHPDTAFAILGLNNEAGENVMGFTLKVEEGAFLAGVIAASVSTSHIIGFIGASGDTTEKAYEYGFRSGVKSISPNARVLVDYADFIYDPVRGRIEALSQIGQGVDVIFQPAGESGESVIKAADDMGVFAIDSSTEPSLKYAGNVLCTVFSRVDHAIYMAVQTLQEAKFEGKLYQFGLDFLAVGYVDTFGNLSDEVKALADAYGIAVAAGDIRVPKTWKEFGRFKVQAEGLPIQ